MALFSTSFWLNEAMVYRKNIFTVYSIKDKTVLSFIHHGNAIVLSDDTLTVNHKTFRNNVYNHLAEERIRNISFSCFSDPSILTKRDYGELISWQDIRILRLTKQLPDVPLSTLLDGINYVIISDAEAYQQLSRNWKGRGVEFLILSSVKEKSRYLRRDFYYLKKEGAYRKELE